MKEKIKFIKKITRELSYIALSGKCGKYYSLVRNDDNTVSALYFKGENGYGSTDVDKLSENNINKIYDDLKDDF